MPAKIIPSIRKAFASKMVTPTENPDAGDGIAPANTNASGESPHPRPSGLPKIIQFDDLPHCGEEVWIASDGKLYRLRRTRQGKLVLTK